MGRKSKLSDAQWGEIETRMLNGEGIRPLAREYGVSESSLRAQKSKRVEKIKDVANHIVAAECAIKELDLDARCAVFDYAAKLRAMHSNLLQAAYNGGIIAAKMTEIAVKQAGKVNHDTPMESQEELQAISALTRIANDASTGGMNLLKLTQDQVSAITRDTAKRNPISVSLRVQDAS